MSDQQSQGGFQKALQHLTDEILAGRVEPGSRLPSERELAEEIGVGRGAVREAIKVLQAQGLVTSQVGPTGGTRIASSQGSSFGRMLQLHLALQQISHDELTETRVLLERAATEAAATTAGDDVLADLDRACDAMEDATSPEEFNDLDTAFHVDIAQAARNRLVRDLTIALRHAVAGHILRAERDLTDWDALRQRLVTEHRAILAALADRNGPRAAELAEQHVRGAHSVLLPRDQTPLP